MNRSTIQLRPHAPRELTALIDSIEAYERLTGLRVAAGLREFLVGGEVSPAWLEKLRSASAADPWVHGFGIVETATNTLIGTTGYKGPPDGDGVVEIAYGIAPSFEGRGYATAAADALVAFASADPRVCRIRAHTFAQGNASSRVLETNGFTFVGEVIDPEDGWVSRWEREPSRQHSP